MKLTGHEVVRLVAEGGNGNRPHEGLAITRETVAAITRNLGARLENDKKGLGFMSGPYVSQMEAALPLMREAMEKLDAAIACFDKSSDVHTSAMNAELLMSLGSKLEALGIARKEATCRA